MPPVRRPSPSSPTRAAAAGGTGKAEIVAQFSNAGSYTICAECGRVNGESGLTQVDQAVANFAGVKVYQGEVAGQRIMTAACLQSTGSVIKDLEVNVMLPRPSVEGYDLYQVNLDGTETKLEINGQRQVGLCGLLHGRRRRPGPHGSPGLICCPPLCCIHRNPLQAAAPDPRAWRPLCAQKRRAALPKE